MLQQETNVVLGLLFMSGSICCSVIISLILKFHETRKGSRLVALASNYIVATMINLVIWWRADFSALSYKIILLGIGVGGLFVFTFLIMMICIGRVGVAISVSTTRLAVILPISSAILFFKEEVSFFYIPGLILALVSFLLFGKAVAQQEVSGRRTWNRWLLISLFVSMGITGIAVQVFEKKFLVEQRSGFLALVFGVALVWAWFFVVYRREKIRRSDIKLGLLMGIPNGLSAVFFMSALRHLSDIVVFPVNDASIVVLSTLGAYLIWREKLNRTGWIALAVAVAAIALMNL